MEIKLKFFASVREQLNVSEEMLTIPADIVTVADLRALLIARGAVWAETLAQGRAIRTALNLQMCNSDVLLSEGAEVAFFPPVTGG